MGSKFFQIFIDRKTRLRGCNLKQHATGLAKVDGTKVGSINYRGDIVAEIEELSAPRQLFLFVARAKRDVVHRTGSDPPGLRVGQANQIDDSARRILVARNESEPITRCLNQTIAKHLGEQTSAVFVAFHRSRHVVKSAQRLLWWNRASRPRLDWNREDLRDAIKQETGRIAKAHNFFSETRPCFFCWHMLAFQPVGPVTEGVG